MNQPATASVGLLPAKSKKANKRSALFCGIALLVAGVAWATVYYFTDCGCDINDVESVNAAIESVFNASSSSPAGYRANDVIVVSNSANGPKAAYTFSRLSSLAWLPCACKTK